MSSSHLSALSTQHSALKRWSMPRQIGDIVLEVHDLHTHIFTRWGVVKAVDGVSFYLRQGETLGIVGESGCGKTMTALSLLRLVPRPGGRIIQGKIMLEGENLLDKSDNEMRHIRGRRISMILQDPQTSLNPVFSIGNQLIEGIRIHHRQEGYQSLVRRAIEALKQVRVAAPERRVQDYPHQMSGGMKQRVVGAISISCEPRVIIADEPTTSLDVTIQAQYLRLLREIQENTGLSLIFITHDFGIVAKMCDRVMVMYAGRVVESGPVREIFNKPSHPYTQALLSSVPKLEERPERLYSIQGQPPALWDVPPGCRFAARCAYADDRCQQAYPPSFTVGEGHIADCWRLEDSWKNQ
jgi:oligopeptide/dipeptide ABC transporter ATP-binding protein